MEASAPNDGKVLKPGLGILLPSAADGIFFEFRNLVNWQPGDEEDRRAKALGETETHFGAEAPSYIDAPIDASRTNEYVFLVSSSLPPRIIRLLCQLRDMPWHLASSSDEKSLAVLGYNSLDVLEWAANGVTRTTIHLPWNEKIRILNAWRKITWSQDGRLLAVAGADGRVDVFSRGGLHICCIEGEAPKGSVEGFTVINPVCFLGFTNDAILHHRHKQAQTSEQTWTHELLVLGYDAVIHSYLIDFEAVYQRHTVSFPVIVSQNDLRANAHRVLRWQHTYKFNLYTYVLGATLDFERKCLLLSGCRSARRGHDGEMSVWNLSAEAPYYQSEEKDGADTTRKRNSAGVFLSLSELRDMFSPKPPIARIGQRLRAISHMFSISPSGQNLISVNLQGEIVIWTFSTGKWTQSIKLGSKDVEQATSADDKVKEPAAIHHSKESSTYYADPWTDDEVDDIPSNESSKETRTKLDQIVGATWWSERVLAVSLSSGKTVLFDYFNKKSVLNNVDIHGNELGAFLDCKEVSSLAVFPQKRLCVLQVERGSDSEEARRNKAMSNLTFKLQDVSSLTCEDVVKRHIATGDYEAALSFCASNNGDTDFVYKARWQDKVDGDLDLNHISGLLGAIQDDLWVLEQTASTILQTKESQMVMLSYGITRSDRVLGSMTQMTPKELSDMVLNPQRGIEGSIIAGKLALRLEIVIQLRLLETFSIIMESTEERNQSSKHQPFQSLFRSFRMTPILAHACFYAACGSLSLLQTMLERHSHELNQFREALVAMIPESIDPFEYLHFLPCNEIGPGDWNLEFNIEDIVLKEPLHSCLKQISQPDRWIHISEQKLQNMNIVISKFSKEQSIHENNKLRWYLNRAVSIEAKTGMLDYALKLLESDSEWDMEAKHLINILKDDLSLLSSIASLSNGVGKALNLQSLSKLGVLDVLALLVQSTPDILPDKEDPASTGIESLNSIEDTVAASIVSYMKSLHQKWIFQSSIQGKFPIFPMQILSEEASEILIHFLCDQLPKNKMSIVVQIFLRCQLEDPSLLPMVFANKEPFGAALLRACSMASILDEEILKNIAHVIENWMEYSYPSFTSSEELLKAFGMADVHSNTVTEQMTLLGNHVEVARFLLQIGINIPLSNLSQISGDRREQNQLLFRIINMNVEVSTSNVPEKKSFLLDIFKMKHEYNFLDLVREEEILTHFISACFSAGNFSQLRETLESNYLEFYGIDQGVVETQALNHARDYIDNATSTDITVGGLFMAKQCLQVVPQCTSITQEMNLIEAIHELGLYYAAFSSDYHLLPIEVRLATNRVAFVDKVIMSERAIYHNPEKVINLTKKLGYDGIGAEASIWAKLVNASLIHNELQSASALVVKLIDLTSALVHSSGQITLDYEPAKKEVISACQNYGTDDRISDFVTSVNLAKSNSNNNTLIEEVDLHSLIQKLSFALVQPNSQSADISQLLADYSNLEESLDVAQPRLLLIHHFWAASSDSKTHSVMQTPHYSYGAAKESRFSHQPHDQNSNSVQRSLFSSMLKKNFQLLGIEKDIKALAYVAKDDMLSGIPLVLESVKLSKELVIYILAIYTLTQSKILSQTLKFSLGDLEDFHSFLRLYPEESSLHTQKYRSLINTILDAHQGTMLQLKDALELANNFGFKQVEVILPHLEWLLVTPRGFSAYDDWLRPLQDLLKSPYDEIILQMNILHVKAIVKGTSKHLSHLNVEISIPKLLEIVYTLGQDSIDDLKCLFEGVLTIEEFHRTLTLLSNVQFVVQFPEEEKKAQSYTKPTYKAISDFLSLNFARNILTESSNGFSLREISELFPFMEPETIVTLMKDIIKHQTSDLQKFEKCLLFMVEASSLKDLTNVHQLEQEALMELEQAYPDFSQLELVIKNMIFEAMDLELVYQTHFLVWKHCSHATHSNHLEYFNQFFANVLSSLIGFPSILNQKSSPPDLDLLKNIIHAVSSKHKVSPEAEWLKALSDTVCFKLLEIAQDSTLAPALRKFIIKLIERVRFYGFYVGIQLCTVTLCAILSSEWDIKVDAHQLDNNEGRFKEFQGVLNERSLSDDNKMLALREYLHVWANDDLDAKKEQVEDASPANILHSNSWLNMLILLADFSRYEILISIGSLEWNTAQVPLKAQHEFLSHLQTSTSKPFQLLGAQLSFLSPQSHVVGSALLSLASLQYPSFISENQLVHIIILARDLEMELTTNPALWTKLQHTLLSNHNEEPSSSVLSPHKFLLRHVIDHLKNCDQLVFAANLASQYMGVGDSLHSGGIAAMSGISIIVRIKRNEMGVWQLYVP
ncbi:hypothetical protein M427DRAFT_46518 [Gonapodya prolifera JEL478]|uniref:Uncharacterized protein n=1 Tax=Gonapodya prolifera (strain JEL478) TaxID=1344416 RepID=A0A139A6K4_GONPJ|nr:hypothetical protein M427DRAFT_46518 [Gonapodya prolifera JEL478]|eukprot:KXS12075.1 hypothetical protein M427DRAFT_46518 [Gonapodya prolifera JEL478]